MGCFLCNKRLQRLCDGCVNSINISSYIRDPGFHVSCVLDLGCVNLINISSYIRVHGFHVSCVLNSPLRYTSVSLKNTRSFPLKVLVHPLSNGFLANKRKGKKSNHTHYYALMVQRCRFWPIYRPWNEYHDSNYPLYGWGDFNI